MNSEVIGSNAGVVWSALNLKNPLPLKVLKKVTKFKDKEVYPALGWLAREGKIAFTETDEDVVVTLL